MYSAPGVRKLCYDATERYHLPGRFIYHVPRGFNLKLEGPYFVREVVDRVCGSKGQGRGRSCVIMGCSQRCG